MRNLKITLEYKGSNYAGWQVQGQQAKTAQSKPTIQETIESILSRVLQEKVRLIASGRTDAGVHALAQVANFRTYSQISRQKLRKALNSLLPDDIAVSSVKEVPQDFHSRFCARSKVYRYSVLNRSHHSAFLGDTAYFCPYSLNLSLMRRQARYLLGRHNFRAFAASDGKKRGYWRTIKRIKIDKRGALLYIEIEADGFLYNMARNIAGTLIDMGRGRVFPGGLKRILLSRERSLAGPTAPAKGLCLVKVKY